MPNEKASEILYGSRGSQNTWCHAQVGAELDKGGTSQGGEGICQWERLGTYLLQTVPFRGNEGEEVRSQVRMV